MRNRNRNRRPEAGLAFVEMAFVTPFLLLLIFVGGDFGRIMYHGITMTNAARAGANYGAQSTAHTTDSTGIEAAAQNEVTNFQMNVSSQRICECPGTGVVACTLASCGAYGAPQAFVEVTTTATFQPVLFQILGLLDLNTPVTQNLVRVAKVRVQ